MIHVLLWKVTRFKKSRDFVTLRVTYRRQNPFKLIYTSVFVLPIALQSQSVWNYSVSLNARRQVRDISLWIYADYANLVNLRLLTAFEQDQDETS
jgi:hypothetical protein